MTPTVIPASALPDTSRIQKQSSPGYTYKLDLKSKRIVGMTDGQHAVTQMIYKTLYTARYAYLIYNWDYGFELEQYLGEDFDYVMADIERSITEALMVDDRILGIQDFRMQKTRIDSLYVEFTAITTEGYSAIEYEVKF